MRPATAHDTTTWHHPPRKALNSLTFTNPLNFRPLLNDGHTRRVEACIFEDTINWSEPRYPTTQPLLHINTGLVFKDCIFKKPLNWAQCCFELPIEFASCRFEEYVDFTGSRFRGASFKDCTFHEKAYFEDAMFFPQEQQTSTTCSENCPKFFPSSPGHQQNSAQTQNTQPHCANFRAVIFKDGAEFDRVRFDVPACFHKALFHGSTTFFQSGFGRTRLDCSYAHIFGAVEFHQGLRSVKPLSRGEGADPATPLTGPGGGEIVDDSISADMRYIHVHSQQGLRFHSENLEQCLVVGTNLEACHFINVRWPMVASHYPLYFKKHWILMGPLHFVQVFIGTAVRLIFRWMMPHEEAGDRHNSQCHRPWIVRCVEYLRSCGTPQQHGIFDHKDQIGEQDNKLRSGASYNTIRKWRSQWTHLSRAYRDLKAAYEGNKDYIYASDFHYAEKELRRINHEVPRHTRFQLQLYWLVSGYGERVLRPIWWFLAIWLLGALPYYLWGTYAHPKNGEGLIREHIIVGADCVSQAQQCEHLSEEMDPGGKAYKADTHAESMP